jgi:hypothetical protein
VTEQTLRDHREHRRRARTARYAAKSISGQQTDRMREHYSTVTPDEQRRSIRNVVNLFGPRSAPAQSGEGPRASGEGKQKAQGD